MKLQGTILTGFLHPSNDASEGNCCCFLRHLFVVALFSLSSVKKKLRGNGEQQTGLRDEVAASCCGAPAQPDTVGKKGTKSRDLAEKTIK